MSVIYLRLLTKSNLKLIFKLALIVKYYSVIVIYLCEMCAVECIKLEEIYT